MGKQKLLVKDVTTSVWLSYSQLFFSDNLWFASILMIVTFLDVWMGISGLLSVLTANLIAYFIGLHRATITKGYYGFNALLTGLGLSLYFSPNLPFFALIILTAMLTLFFTVACEGIIGKYKLPYLSIPFLLSIWIMTLATREFDSLVFSERGIYILNDLYQLGGDNMLVLYNWWNSIPFPLAMRTYFISLGAIFFQYNVLAGVLISIGLLYYSRIAFTLSILGFTIAYLFYHFIGIEISGLSYSYIGFNYILTAIAIGGFFVIPSLASYTWVAILIPLVTVISISTSQLLAVYQLSVYSLPFNIIVILFLYVLKSRFFPSQALTEVLIQQNQPEKNLYAVKNNNQRFQEMYEYVQIKLPFWGEWTVSQGHNGEYTHKQEWRHAWDFVITDEQEKQFYNDGSMAEDYYCYDKLVIAPAAGVVVLIIDGIPDNPINEVNIKDNWGNTIIIKHNELLYSKLSHLKAGTYQVNQGDYVYAGQPLAHCGNSGRSPFPHLHFQLQSTPFFNAPSLDYPIAHYVQRTGKAYDMYTYHRPKEDAIISNIYTSPVIKKAFNFIPGKQYKFEVDDGSFIIYNNWEVIVDMYNNTYLYCQTTGSKAYFINDGDIHYFRHFEGNKNSLLYYFFLGAYKVQMGFYKNLILTDEFPVNILYKRWLLFIQDFIAPFHIFLKGRFVSQYTFIDNELSPGEIVLHSVIDMNYKTRNKKNMSITIGINQTGLNQIYVQSGETFIEATCISE